MGSGLDGLTDSLARAAATDSGDFKASTAGPRGAGVGGVALEGLAQVSVTNGRAIRGRGSASGVGVGRRVSMGALHRGVSPVYYDGSDGLDCQTPCTVVCCVRVVDIRCRGALGNVISFKRQGGRYRGELDGSIGLPLERLRRLVTGKPLIKTGPLREVPTIAETSRQGKGILQKGSVALCRRPEVRRGGGAGHRRSLASLGEVRAVRVDPAFWQERRGNCLGVAIATGKGRRRPASATRRAVFRPIFLARQTFVFRASRSLQGGAGVVARSRGAVGAPLTARTATSPTGAFLSGVDGGRNSPKLFGEIW